MKKSTEKEKMLIVRNSAPVVLTLVLVGGCSWFDREPAYREARSGDTLRVPEGLTRPIPPAELAVPNAAGSDFPAEHSGEPPEVVLQMSRQSKIDPDVGAYLSIDSGALLLVVRDSPDSVWRRTKSALEQSGASILGSDQGEMQYRVAYVSQAPVPKRSIWSRLNPFSKDQEQSQEYSFDLKIQSRSGHTKVTLHDAEGYVQSGRVAEELLEKLADRLG